MPEQNTVATSGAQLAAAKPALSFHEGDQVVLALGSNQGTLGVFLRPRQDPNWADITERNGNVRSHPVEWLAHAEGGSTVAQ